MLGEMLEATFMKRIHALVVPRVRRFRPNFPRLVLLMCRALPFFSTKINSC
jgi:hypothetical protein